MNQHPDMTEYFSRLIDQDLTEKEKEVIYAHVKSCPQCQTQLREMMLVSKALSETKTPPASLKSQIMDSIQSLPAENISRSSKKKKVWMPYLAAAACLLIIVVSVSHLSSLSASAPASAGNSKQAVTEEVTAESSEYEAEKAEEAEVPVEEESTPEISYITFNDLKNYCKALVLNNTLTPDFSYQAVSTFSKGTLEELFPNLPDAENFSVYECSESDLLALESASSNVESSGDLHLYEQAAGSSYYLITPAA